MSFCSPSALNALAFLNLSATILSKIELSTESGKSALLILTSIISTPHISWRGIRNFTSVVSGKTFDNKETLSSAVIKLKREAPSGFVYIIICSLPIPPSYALASALEISNLLELLVI